MEKKLSLSVCFQLGKALRYSDADAFLTLYDSLLCDRRVDQDQQVLISGIYDIVELSVKFHIINYFLVVSCEGMVSSDIRAESKGLLTLAHCS